MVQFPKAFTSLTGNGKIMIFCNSSQSRSGKITVNNSR